VLFSLLLPSYGLMQDYYDEDEDDDDVMGDVLGDCV
jgi:hypothetical protein